MGSQGACPWDPREGCPWDPRMGAHGIPGVFMGTRALGDPLAPGDLGPWGLGPWARIFHMRVNINNFHNFVLILAYTNQNRSKTVQLLIPKIWCDLAKLRKM